MLCSKHNERPHHFIVKPPFDFKRLSKYDQRQANYLSYRYHGLSWQIGRTPFHSVISFLQAIFNHADSDTVFLVKGNEKKSWLANLYGNGGNGDRKIDNLIDRIINLEDEGCNLSLQK